MQIRLICVGTRMPRWVEEGFREYAKRMPKECELILVEIAAGKRNKNANLAQIRDTEGKAVLSAIGSSDYVVALEVEGRNCSTQSLSELLKEWMEGGRNVSILVGGPEGLSEACKQKAALHLSLSSLTLPHPLVRILFAEQLYRAWTILSRHPYHR